MIRRLGYFYSFQHTIIRLEKYVTYIFIFNLFHFPAKEEYLLIINNIQKRYIINRVL